MSNKARKRALTFALTFALLLLMACVDDDAAGDNITWTFDASTGVLTLSGTGAMRDWDWDWENRAPWATHMHNNTTSIVISNGITTIGDTAFAGANRLTSVYIPPSVTHIGREAFMHASSLTSATIRSRNAGFCLNVFRHTHPDFTIHAFINSPAHTLAVDRGYNFVPLD